MIIDLPWPAKELWPNGGDRTHPGKIARLKKAHRQWGCIATREVMPIAFKHDGAPIPLKIIVHAKPRGRVPDRDNCIAACKSLLDGVADALGVNDQLFIPSVEFSEERDGRMVFSLGIARG